MLRVVTFPEAETPAALRRQVHAMQDEAWPSVRSGEASEPGTVHDPALRPLSMVLVDGDTVLSALDVLFTGIVHSDRSWSVAGLSTVVTPLALRGRGYARTLVTRARDALPALAVDLGIFTCDRPLLGFYESCGWEPLPGTVLVGGTPERPFPSDRPGFDKVTLASFVSVSALSRRRAFVEARVLLYSGDIDRLW